MEVIGECKVKDGKITHLDRGWLGQGWGFKDPNAYKTDKTAPCYVQELSENDEFYTGNDILDLCNNQQEIADKVFDMLDWQAPSSLIDEWFNDGELAECESCGKWYFAYEEDVCPHCGYPTAEAE